MDAGDADGDFNAVPTSDDDTDDDDTGDDTNGNGGNDTDVSMDCDNTMDVETAGGGDETNAEGTALEDVDDVDVDDVDVDDDVDDDDVDVAAAAVRDFLLPESRGGRVSPTSRVRFMRQLSSTNRNFLCSEQIVVDFRKWYNTCYSWRIKKKNNNIMCLNEQVSCLN